MKNTLRKFVSAALVALVLTLSASVLLACNSDAKKRERDRQARIDSVAAVENVFLSSVNEDWRADVGNEQLVTMNSASDYIVATEWTKFVCDVLVSSSLQTGKLQVLAEIVQSEEGKKLIDDFSENAELIVPLFKRVDFTPTDISNLVYDLLCALAEKSGSVFDGIIARAEEIREMNGVTPEVYQSLGGVIGDMSAAKNKLVPTAAERDEMLTAFEKAKEPMSALIEFVYNMSVTVANDNLFDILLGGEGALADISNSEIITLIGTLRENIADLRLALTEDAVGDLNGAFDLIINKFDGSSVASVLYAQIVQYSKTAYMLVDVIPFMCDIAYSASEVLMDDAFIGELKQVVGKELNGYAKVANNAIIMAKLVTKVTDTFSMQTFKDLISDIRTQSMGDYRKSVPLVIVDVMFNISNLFEGGNLENLKKIETIHPDIIDEDTFGVLINTLIVTLDSSMERFKAAYEEYLVVVAGNSIDTSAYNNMRSVASIFESFGMENKFNTSESALEAAEWYMLNAERIINSVVDKNNIKIEADLAEFIKDYYAENSDIRQAALQLANMPLLSEDISEAEYAQYISLATKSRIMVLVALISAEM